MSWLKSSDTSDMHPIVVAPLSWDPDSAEPLQGGDLVNVLYGLAHRCAVWSAAYDEDYFVPAAIVAMMAQTDRWRQRAEQAARAGYWTAVEGGWRLVADSERLFHIRLKAEKEWEAQRRKDNGNPSLVVPVRMRDGDGCRYCGKIVSWEARRGNRAGTYDHRVAGRAAAGPDDLYVCCGWCNSCRGKDPEFDTKYPRRPAPTDPYYGAETVELLARHGITVPCSDDARPGSQPVTATAPPPRDPAASRPRTTATPQPAGHRDRRDPAAGGAPRTRSTATHTRPAGPGRSRQKPAGRKCAGPDRYGSGRVSGRAGLGSGA